MLQLAFVGTNCILQTLVKTTFEEESQFVKNLLWNVSCVYEMYKYTLHLVHSGNSNICILYSESTLKKYFLTTFAFICYVPSYSHTLICLCFFYRAFFQQERMYSTHERLLEGSTSTTSISKVSPLDLLMLEASDLRGKNGSNALMRWPPFSFLFPRVLLTRHFWRIEWQIGWWKVSTSLIRLSIIVCSGKCQSFCSSTRQISW